MRPIDDHMRAGTALTSYRDVRTRLSATPYTSIFIRIGVPTRAVAKNKKGIQKHHGYVCPTLYRTYRTRTLFRTD